MQGEQVRNEMAEASLTPADPSTQSTPEPSLPERSCVTCRTAGSPETLLRLACTRGHVHVAHRGRGRGAWVCIRRSCLEALSLKQLSRSLRQSVNAFEAAAFLHDVGLLAEQRVLESVGLARRQGELVVGVDQVRTAGSGEGGVTLLADDASERSSAALGEGCHRFVSVEKMSKAAGLYNVNALRINPGRLAHQAAYWLSVWYECRAREARTGDQRE
jgi:predicted RNA-binding protein YlxR (DUF448 family)